MNKLSDVERFELTACGDQGYHTIRIPTMVVTDEGTLLVFAEGRKNSPADDGDVNLVMLRSNDGGENWSDIQTVYSFGERENHDVTTGNPCPIVDHDTGDLVVLFCRDNERCYCVRSSDDGMTWTGPREITAIFDDFNYPDRQRLATGPVHGIQRENGELVAPVWLNNMPLHAHTQLKQRCHDNPELLNENKDSVRCGVIASVDHGRTWEVRSLVPATIPWLNESTVCERDDGSLLLNMRAHMQNRRARAVSDDGGRTWSEPELCEDLPDSTCQGSILKLVRGSTSGKVILSNLNQTIDDYGDVNHCLERRNLSISVSDDQGATFPRKYSVNPGPSGYSDLAQIPDGRVVCVFENGDEVYRERLSLVRFALSQQC